ncbi:hypothetical protein J437_LFUL007137 [Ladona fulva]|uniref:Uncharacterized protein n=1 Tax=Ladona fulva TaxID=123851 RepID=A0A8K0K6J8_LADFU|nr:hypothetical protein J437_LFUL007137 [Ladona fulva]
MIFPNCSSSLPLPSSIEEFNDLFEDIILSVSLTASSLDLAASESSSNDAFLGLPRAAARVSSNCVRRSQISLGSFPLQRDGSVPLLPSRSLRRERERLFSLVSTLKDELKCLTKDLNLSKESFESLASRLNDKNLLEQGAKMTFYSTREKDMLSFFTQEDNLIEEDIMDLASQTSYPLWRELPGAGGTYPKCLEAREKKHWPLSGSQISSCMVTAKMHDLPKRRLTLLVKESIFADLRSSSGGVLDLFTTLDLKRR